MDRKKACWPGYLSTGHNLRLPAKSRAVLSEAAHKVNRIRRTLSKIGGSVDLSSWSKK